MKFLKRFFALFNTSPTPPQKMDTPAVENLALQQVKSYDLICNSQKLYDLEKKVSYMNVKFEKMLKKIDYQADYIISMSSNLEEILNIIDTQAEMLLEFDNIAIAEATKKDKPKVVDKEWFEHYGSLTIKKDELN